MKKLILSGCNGKMGYAVTRAVMERDDCEIVAGVDLNTEEKFSYPVFSAPAQINVEADALIDFSHPKALPALLAYAELRRMPCVIATTGLAAEDIARLKASSARVPLFFSGNMSLGINLMLELARKATAVLGGDFDIEIVEKHHNQKIDAPSGTALMLADAVSETLNTNPKLEFDRHSKRMKRTKNEIGIHSVRGGTIVGEHEVIFAGHDEVITLTHSAQSKEIFATGAINAALFLIGKKEGLYNMGDLVAER